MGKLALCAALTIALAGTANATVQNTGLFGTRSILTKNTTLLYKRPGAGHSGQHFKNSLGCIYARTQVAGHPVVWHLQINTRVPGCPYTILGA